MSTRGRAGRAPGWILLTLGAGAWLVLTVLLVFPELHRQHAAVIVAATFIPVRWIALIIRLLGLALVLAGRRRLIGVVGAALVAAVWLGPAVGHAVAPRGEAAMAEPALTVLTLNLQYGRADVGQVLEAASSSDVLLLQEYTSVFHEAATAGGLLEEFPHHEGTIREDAGGTMILSREPATLVETVPGTLFDNIVVTTTVRGVGFTVANIHTSPPQVGARAWSADAEAVAEMARARMGDNLVLAGDFNAIDEHATMRVLTTPPLRDAAHSRHGFDRWVATWPAALPFARIDHVLVGDSLDAVLSSVVRVEGTDHLGVVAYVWERP